MGGYNQDWLEADNAFQGWLKAKGKTVPTKTKTIMMPTQIVGVDFAAERALRKEWQAERQAEGDEE